MITNFGKSDLMRMQRLAQQSKTVAKTIKESQGDFKKTKENMDLLYSCANDWAKLDYVRRNRKRIFDYKNGKQWDEYVQDPDTGKMIKEDALISKNGKTPLKHNLIQTYFKNIHGQRASNPSQSVVHTRCSDETDLGDMLTNALQAVQEINDVDTLDENVLEELLAGGIAITKTGYTYWSEKNMFDGTYSLVNTNRFFCNPDFEDPRLNDVRRLGEIHDYTFEQMIHNFAKNKADEDVLREEYKRYWHNDSFEELLQSSQEALNTIDFYGHSQVGKYRVIEVWQQLGRWVLYTHDTLNGTEQIYESGLTMGDVDKINRRRIEECAAVGIPAEQVRTVYAEERYEWYWQVKFLTPTGLCLKEMETPYAHESHPYAIACMPIIDGVITPVIVDIVDLQRYINRLVVMIDFIMSASSKGVLAIPEECIAKAQGWKLEDYSREWVKANGVILVAQNATGRMPTQISANSTNIGAWEMLKLELDLMQQISGLSGAIQGQVANSNTPASLYAQQAQNSMLNFFIVFSRLDKYCQKRDEKMLKIIMSKYNEPRYIDINGSAFSETAKMYYPEMIRKITHWNLKVAKSMDTPTYRQLNENFMLDMVKMGALPFEVYLKNSSIPYSEKILSDIKAFNDAAMQGELDPSSLRNLSNQVSANQTPEQQASMGMLNKFLQGDGAIQGPAA